MTMRTGSIRVLLGVAALSLGTAGIAQATWSSTGSGSGSATTGETMTIAAEALSGETPDTSLYPGGTADAVLKIRNPNSGPVRVVGITATSTPVAANGCSPGGVSFTPPSGFSGPQFTLPAGQATVLHLIGAMAMDTTSASACQGQAFSLLVTVTVQQ
jgi:hypothetical protein